MKLRWNPFKYADALGILKPGGQLSDEMSEKNDGWLTDFHNKKAPWIVGSIFGGMAAGGAFGGGAAGGAGGATAFPVGGSGAPEIAGFATGADPFVSASGGSLMGAPGSMPMIPSGMNWMDYGRMANMGVNMMGQSTQQGGYTPQLQTDPQGVLRSPYYSQEFVPVYPGALHPFITRG